MRHGHANRPATSIWCSAHPRHTPAEYAHALRTPCERPAAGNFHRSGPAGASGPGACGDAFPRRRQLGTLAGEPPAGSRHRPCRTSAGRSMPGCAPSAARWKPSGERPSQGPASGAGAAMRTGCTGSSTRSGGACRRLARRRPGTAPSSTSSTSHASRRLPDALRSRALAMRVQPGASPRLRAPLDGGFTGRHGDRGRVG